MVRQAMAGMLWSKQYFEYDVERWLAEHGLDPLDAGGIRNGEWFHLDSHDVISMPDTWEYPWFAAWDLAFQAVTLGLIDMRFAKGQLDLLLSRRFLHPNGQIPAYEWNFSDVNPPVHAWAVYLLYELEKSRSGRADRAWLETAFHKLATNFTWWVNRKDTDGRNIFQGGFLGLDNIGVFDRSAPLPTGGHLDQADGTAWMALFCQNMVQIAVELAEDDPVYLEQAQTYLEHFAWIAVAVNRTSGKTEGMWDEEDGFFYDLLRLPDGSASRMKVRSMVGLLPLAAATVIRPEVTARYPELVDGARELVARHPSVTSVVSEGRFGGTRGHYMLALFDQPKLRRMLGPMLDENEFLSPYGIRSVSRYHAEHPFGVEVDGRRYEVSYLPAESDTGMFGGNSNWRGPIWFPMNALIIRALLNLHVGYGDEFTVECPTGSGRYLTLFEVAREISDRLTRIFLPDADGHRPCYGGQAIFAEDEHWRDLLDVLGVLPRRQRGRARRQPPDRLDRPGRGVPEPVRAGLRPGSARRRRGRCVPRAAGEGSRMSEWPSAPVVYEVDTWPWLTDVRGRLGAPATLGDLPAEVWDELAPPGTDAVWLMGVWERSPAGLATARENDGLRRAFHAALPDLTTDDVVGSPYCVRRYIVDKRLGGPAGLAAARAELARRGLRLILDYVPNHVAPDHPAVTSHPDWFVTGTAEDLAAAPDDVVRGRRARDRPRPGPVLPALAGRGAAQRVCPRLRQATADALGTILDQCDGVRCDMAMLLTTEVFARTWGAVRRPGAGRGVLAAGHRPAA